MGLAQSYSSNSDVRSQVYSNSFIFKENLKLIASTLIETIWRDKISSSRLDSTIQHIKAEANRGDLDLIKERDEEILSSIYFSKVENANESNFNSNKKQQEAVEVSRMEDIVKSFQKEATKDIKTKLKSICLKRPSLRGEKKFKESFKFERKIKAKSSLKNKTPCLSISRKYKSIKNTKNVGNITELYNISHKGQKSQSETKFSFFHSEKKVKQIVSKEYDSIGWISI